MKRGGQIGTSAMFPLVREHVDGFSRGIVIQLF
jgi:hypothetical protein